LRQGKKKLGFTTSSFRMDVNSIGTAAASKKKSVGNGNK